MQTFFKKFGPYCANAAQTANDNKTSPALDDGFRHQFLKLVEAGKNGHSGDIVPRELNGFANAG